MKIHNMLALPLALVASVAAWCRPAPTTQVSQELRELMAHVSFVDIDDGAGGTVRTLRFSGINVQVVNGLDATDTINGSGNLIVGYNEFGYLGGTRTGSHNIVGGRASDYFSFGGFVVGENNGILGPWCSVSGGRENGAGGIWGSVSGGTHNVADGAASSVSGGYNGSASGVESWVGGGIANAARGELSAVSGGGNNHADGSSSSVSGGESRTATDTGNWAAGSLYENN